MKKIFFLLFHLIIGLPLLAQRPELVVQTGHSAPITDIDFNANGRYVVSSSWDRMLKIWDVTTKKELRTLPDFTEGLTSAKVAFSSDSRFVASGSADGTLKIWESMTGRVIHTLSEGQGEIGALDFHPKNNRIAVGWGDGSIKIWDAASGELLQNMLAHTDLVTSLTYSYDGRTILSAANDGKLMLWDDTKMNIKEILANNAGQIASAAFSPDDKYVICGGNDGLVKVFKSTGKYINAFEGHLDNIVKVDFSADGQTIISGDKGGKIIIWDAVKGDSISEVEKSIEFLNTLKFLPSGEFFMANHQQHLAVYRKNGQLVRQLTGEKSENIFDFVNTVKFSPDGKNIVSGGGDRKLHFWGEATGITIQTEATVVNSTFSPNGKLVAVSDAAGTISLWNTTTGDSIRAFLGHNEAVNSLGFTPNGRYLLSGGEDKKLIVWEVATGKLLRTMTGHTQAIYSISVHRSGQLVAASDGDGLVKVWHILTGKEYGSYKGIEGLAMSVSFTPDGYYVLSGSDAGMIKIWDIESTELVYEVQAQQGMILSLDFSPNGEYLIIGGGGNDKTVSLWDVITIEYSGTFVGHSEGISSVSFHNSGRLFATGSYDNTVRLWSIEEEDPIAVFYNLGQQDWAIVTPDGMFDASDGAMAQMHYVVGLEPIELEQVKERYYEPDLLQKLLGYNTEPLRNVVTFDEVALFPKIELDIKGERKPELNIKLTERNGGLGKVSVYVNNKEIIENVNPNKKDNLKVDLNQYSKYFNFDKRNEIAVRSFNEEGWLSSRMEYIGYQIPKAVARGNGGKITLNLADNYTPQFYGLIIGTSDYRGEALDLSYADKDAADIGNSLNLAAGQLFGRSNVHINILTTSTFTKSSKRNIEKAFRKISKVAKPADIVVVYLSGHGVNYGADKPLFYYLTKDVASGDLSDAQIRENYAVSTNEFTEMLKDIAAQKQIMIIDACSSGGLVDNILTASKNISSSQRRALDRLKDRTGTFILAGSAANKVSYEASQFGQGLLTYSLLLGMSGSALREKQYVDVMQLFQFSADKVPEFAEYVGGIQRPVIAAPRGGNSFDIGQVTPEIKIPLSDVKPIFIRSNFQEETAYDDVLEIGDLLDQKLTDIAAQGQGASIIFVDVKKYPNAYSIKGRYTLQGETLALTGKIFKGKTLINDFTAEGTTSNLEELVDQLLGAITSGLN